MSNFHPLEVVNRGSETQIQVVEKIKSENLTSQVLSSLIFR